MVVGEHDMRVVSLRAGLDVIARDDQPAPVRAIFDLNSGAGTSGIPRPVRRLDSRSDLARLRPARAVVVRAGDEGAPRVLAALRDDFRFRIIASIPREQ